MPTVEQVQKRPPSALNAAPPPKTLIRSISAADYVQSSLHPDSNFVILKSVEMQPRLRNRGLFLKKSREGPSVGRRRRVVEMQPKLPNSTR
jgi:hypothetical protein